MLPVLILILAGIMDFALIFNNLMAMRQGVGASVRQAVVGQTGTGTGACPITGAAGASTETRKLICLTKSLTGLDEATSRIKISFPGSKTKGGSLILCEQSPMESTTSIFDTLLNGALKAKVEMRIEQDLSAFGSVSEDSLPGSSWTWCT